MAFMKIIFDFSDFFPLSIYNYSSLRSHICEMRRFVLILKQYESTIEVVCSVCSKRQSKKNEGRQHMEIQIIFHFC